MTPNSPTNPGLVVIFSGPSGVGKTTIVRQVVRQLGATTSLSLTTRPPASGFVDARDYRFVTVPEFLHHRDAGELLEWAEVYEGCFYGTPRKPVDEALAAGKLMILEIDVAGALQVKQQIPQAFALFIVPPTEAVLLERLRDRGRDDEAAIQRRFAKAQTEIALAKSSGIYDAFIVNAQLDAAVAEAVRRVQERLRRRGPAGS
jgi:guanylate kinase